MPQETKEKIALWGHRAAIAVFLIAFSFGVSNLIGWPFPQLPLIWTLLASVCVIWAIILAAVTSYTADYLVDKAKQRKVESSFAEQVRAAQWGNLEAMVYIGVLYMYERAPRRPDRVKMDLVEAEQWLQRAAQRRYPRSYYWLGMLYLKQARIEEAKAAINAGVQAGDVPAIGALGRMYLSDKYYPKDTDMAVRLLETAAGRGNVRARAVLARVLLNGAKGRLTRLRCFAKLLSAVAAAILVLCTEGFASDRLK